MDMESRMKKSDTVSQVQTFGRFHISVNGETVAKYWPNETLKRLFCSLLSPLDLYITWDRICRSVLEIPAHHSSRQGLEHMYIRPLKGFLIKELGCNPLIVGDDGIRLDRNCMHLDSFEFYCAALEGFRQISDGNHAAALEKIRSATSLYSGVYLPEFSCTIINSTRNELESLYQTAVAGTILLSRNACLQVCERRANPRLSVLSVLSVKSARRSLHAHDFHRAVAV